MSDLLAAVVGAARRAADERARSPQAKDVEWEAATRRPRSADFRAALVGHTPRVIAECKRRSPSRGILREKYDPMEIARQYEAAGAAAISVLTEPTFFDGHLDHLRAVRASVSLPVLRKDFIVTDFQILEARAGGADAVLLIAAALDDEHLTALFRRAAECGLAALVEVHDEVELDRALAAHADLIGVNSRDLRTLEVSPSVFDRLAPAIPDDVVAVAESGLRTGAELRRLRGAGYDAFLIGERFMASADAGEVLAAVLADAAQGADA